MSNNHAKLLVERLLSDEVTAARLQAIDRSPEAIRNFIASEGFECSPEDVYSAFLEQAGENAKGDQGHELADAQLADVAGGGFPAMNYLAERFKLQEAGLLWYNENGETVVIQNKGSA